MKYFISIFIILILVFLFSCEKPIDGELIFYTNSDLINCPFMIELSLNGEKIDTIDASSALSSIKSDYCETANGIGLLLHVKQDVYMYEANEINCIAENKINSWSGQVNVFNGSCIKVFLDISQD